jgi:hypothetical protein
LIRLEPDEAKVSRPVLRGGSGSNAAPLPDRFPSATQPSRSQREQEMWTHYITPSALGNRPGVSVLGFPAPIDHLTGLRPIHRFDTRKARWQRNLIRCLFVTRGPSHPWSKDEAKPVEIAENEEVHNEPILMINLHKPGIPRAPVRPAGWSASDTGPEPNLRRGAESGG